MHTTALRFQMGKLHELTATTIAMAPGSPNDHECPLQIEFGDLQSNLVVVHCMAATPCSGRSTEATHIQLAHMPGMVHPGD